MQFSAILAILAVASTTLAAPSVGPAANLTIEKRATCSVPIYGGGGQRLRVERPSATRVRSGQNGFECRQTATRVRPTTSLCLLLLHARDANSPIRFV
jgi:hypothetical protein